MLSSHVFAAAADSPCIPLAINDVAALKAVGFPVEENADDPGEYRACVREGPPRTLIIFHNGTQAGELDSASTARVFAQTPGFLSSPEKVSDAQPSQRGGGAFVARYWGSGSLAATLLDKNLDVRAKLRRVRALGEWPVGLTIDDELAVAASRSAISRNVLRCHALVRVYFAYLGAGYQGSWFFGETADHFVEQSAGDFRNHSFSLTAGIPFVRYELKSAGWIVPEYFWLEDDIAAVLNGTTEGRTVSAAYRNGDESLTENFCHAIYFRLGRVSVDLLFDPEIYTGCIPRISVNLVPTLFGTWGFALTKADDLWIPGVWLQFPWIHRDLFSFKNYSFPLTIEPLQVFFNYATPRRYNFGCAARVHLRYRSNDRSSNGQ